MNGGISAKTLADGRVLCSLKNRFCQAPSEAAMEAMLRCLRDSVVHVPLELPAGSLVQSALPEGIIGDLVQTEQGEIYMAVFSRREEIPEEYRRKFSWAAVPFIHCIEMIRSREDVSGLVLDGFTVPVLLIRAVLDMCETFESQLTEE